MGNSNRLSSLLLRRSIWRRAGAQQFHNLVQCHEPAGLVTENAFVIFHCQWRGEAWRIFVRIRVTVTADGAPETATELITTQKVGFSGISN